MYVFFVEVSYKIQVSRKDGNNEVRAIVLYDLLITVVLQSTFDSVLKEAEKKNKQTNRKRGKI